MKKLFLLLTLMIGFISVYAQDDSPIVSSAPGETQLYKAEVEAANGFSKPFTHLDEICYRINFDGDKAYIFNMLSIYLPKDFYVVADVVGNEIRIPTGFVYEDRQGIMELRLKRFLLNSNGNWSIDDSDADIVWTIESDGTIRENDPGSAFGLVTYYVDEDDFFWESCVYEDLMLSPTTITTELPENITDVKDYRRFTDYGFNGESFVNEIIKVARDGDDFYFKGLYNFEDSFEIECWVKGRLEGDEVVIDGDQLCGVDLRGYFCYNGVCFLDWDIQSLVKLNEPLKFKFDEEKKEMITEDWFMMTQGHEYIALYFPGSELTYFDPVPAVPAIPELIDWDDEFFESFGTTFFVFLLPYEDEDGKFINPEDMTYSVFFDGDDTPYVFEPSLYTSLSEPMSEFGFYFVSGDITVTPSEGYMRHLIYVRTNDYNSIGVRSYYTVDGVRNESPIMWYHRNQTEVNDMMDAVEVASVEYFDMSGRRLDNPSYGIVIKKTTYADGTEKTSKTVIR